MADVLPCSIQSILLNYRILSTFILGLGTQISSHFILPPSQPTIWGHRPQFPLRTSLTSRMPVCSSWPKLQLDCTAVDCGQTLAIDLHYICLRAWADPSRRGGGGQQWLQSLWEGPWPPWSLPKALKPLFGPLQTMESYRSGKDHCPPPVALPVATRP